MAAIMIVVIIVGFKWWWWVIARSLVPSGTQTNFFWLAGFPKKVWDTDHHHHTKDQKTNQDLFEAKGGCGLV
jgi:hypothetical protein